MDNINVHFYIVDRSTINPLGFYSLTSLTSVLSDIDFLQNFWYYRQNHFDLYQGNQPQGTHTLVVYQRFDKDEITINQCEKIANNTSLQHLLIKNKGFMTSINGYNVANKSVLILIIS